MDTNIIEAVETAAETAANTVADAVFVPSAQNFVDNLSYMASGMIGIFFVIGVIIAATLILNKITAKKK